MANEIITTLHPDQDPDTDLYPNIVQDNIPNKSVIRSKLSDDINSLLDSINELKPSGTDSTTNILAFTQDKGIYVATSGTLSGHWFYWDGTHYVDGGVYQSVQIADGSVTTPKLSPDCLIRYPYLNAVDLNTILTFGRYVCIGCTNGPTSNLLFLDVKVFKTTESNPAWVIQEVYDYTTKYVHFRSNYNGGSWSNWTKLLMDSVGTNDINNNSVTTDKANNDFMIRYPYLNGVDLNTILTFGRYVCVGCTNTPLSATFLLDVKVFKTTESNPSWVIQEVIDTNTKYKYYRYFYNTWSSWHIINIDGDVKRLLGKKILNLGDSIFGNIQGDNSISHQIALLGGCDVINGGFGGCRMSVHDTGTWDLCSMYRIADYIKNNDFSDLIDGVTEGWPGMPYYFPQTANNIANIDYSELDCITISYGTNDYAYDGSVLDNPNDKFDVTSVCGALRYSIKAIQETHPQIKILVTTPIFRMFLDGNYDVLYTSDDHNFGSGTLIEYSEAIKQACKDMHVPCLDLYYDSNMNLYTRLEYWGSTDGTHPNSTGNKNMAILIERYLENILG